MAGGQGNELPLKGIRVVSLEHAIAAPFCTRQLADLGAEVIKVERPRTGDFARNYDDRVAGLSSHFVWTNRSKESLTLDLKSQESSEILEKLLADTDVLVQNLAPGAADRLGLSYETLKSSFPRLIVCSISGYGNSGSYQFKKAYDLLIQSEGGFLSTTGFPGEHGMAKAGCSIADIAAGMYAFTSILSALFLRNRTKQGSFIDVSMLESLVEWMGYPLYYSYEGAEPPQRAGASHASIFPYGPFLAGDGRRVMLGLQNEREWEVFCEQVLGMPDLISDPRFVSNQLRSENREALTDIIERNFENLGAAEIRSLLDECGIANANVNNMHDVWNHPQLRERNSWRKVGSPVGDVSAFVPPGRNSSFEPAMTPVPRLGEHSESILGKLGFTAFEVMEFKEKGII